MRDGAPSLFEERLLFRRAAGFLGARTDSVLPCSEKGAAMKRPRLNPSRNFKLLFAVCGAPLGLFFGSSVEEHIGWAMLIGLAGLWAGSVVEAIVQERVPQKGVVIPELDELRREREAVARREQRKEFKNNLLGGAMIAGGVVVWILYPPVGYTLMALFWGYFCGAQPGGLPVALILIPLAYWAGSMNGGTPVAFAAALVVLLGCLAGYLGACDCKEAEERGRAEAETRFRWWLAAQCEKCRSVESAGGESE